MPQNFSDAKIALRNSIKSRINARVFCVFAGMTNIFEFLASVLSDYFDAKVVVQLFGVAFM